MNLSTGRAQMYAALETARFRWDEIKHVWTDSVQKEFQEKHWEPLEYQVLATVRAIDGLAQVLLQLQQECA
ncbi:MAG: hypothetical protein NZ700_17620 [Gemmataceae bacterium]|nr:hypothetical protein [Gemmataceae bacterium]MDW8266307.1 hypothetical protein [Gemmataceae bacterium]